MAIFFAVILDLIEEVILFDKNSDKFPRGTLIFNGFSSCFPLAGAFCNDCSLHFY